MTHVATIRTTLFTSLALLVCNSIVFAQDDVPAALENQSVPVIESEPILTSPDVMPAAPEVDQVNLAEKQPGSDVNQARPGERVTNPAHEILNLDTKLGGVEIKGTKFTDFGYLGPGDMRTHLWNAHSTELIENGITEHKLMAMTVPEVQEWHNRFHGAEASADHPHEDGELGGQDAIAQQPMTSSPIYGDGTIVYEDGTIVYE